MVISTSCFATLPSPQGLGEACVLWQTGDGLRENRPVLESFRVGKSLHGDNPTLSAWDVCIQRHGEPARYDWRFLGCNGWPGAGIMEADDRQLTSFHSPTVIPPSALDKSSIMKRYHRRRATRWGVTARSPTMVTLHDTQFVECRWWNDSWTVKTVVTWRSSASMIWSQDFHVSRPCSDALHGTFWHHLRGRWVCKWSYPLTPPGVSLRM